MSQQTADNGSKSLVSNPAAKQSAISRSGEKRDHDGHQEALKKRTPAATTTVSKSAPPMPHPAASPKATTVLQTPSPTTPRTVDVRFVLSRPGSKRVSLCGQFNGWSPDETPMKQAESRCWETTLALQPGRYEYKFIADGEWLHDPNARENLPNPHGSLNSVMEVRI